jgi:23S rRNA G2069 N7-methylase RlmK/C1962 C5-methylase RlmI
VPVTDSSLLSRVSLNGALPGSRPGGMRHYRVLTGTGDFYEVLAIDRAHALSTVREFAVRIQEKRNPVVVSCRLVKD